MGVNGQTLSLSVVMKWEVSIHNEAVMLRDHEKNREQIRLDC